MVVNVKMNVLSPRESEVGCNTVDISKYCINIINIETSFQVYNVK